MALPAFLNTCRAAEVLPADNTEPPSGQARWDDTLDLPDSVKRARALKEDMASKRLADLRAKNKASMENGPEEEKKAAAKKADASDAAKNDVADAANVAKKTAGDSAAKAAKDTAEADADAQKATA